MTEQIIEIVMPQQQLPVFTFTKQYTKKGEIQRTKVGRSLLFSREYDRDKTFQILYIQKVVCAKCWEIITLEKPIKKFLSNTQIFTLNCKCAKCGTENKYEF